MEGGVATHGWNFKGDAVLAARIVGDHADLWEIPIYGGEPHLFLQAGLFPDIRRSDGYLVYSHGKFGNRDIRTRNVATGAEQVIHTPDRNEDCYKPRWSPRGESISYECFKTDTNRTEMHIVEADGRNDRHLEFPDLEPSGMYEWAPDGRALITGAIRGSSTNVWRIFVSGRESPQQLTAGSDPERHTTIDPSGHHIAFSRETQSTDLMVVDLKKGEVREAAPFLASAGSAVFWKDGAGMVYRQVRNGLGILLSSSLDDARPFNLNDEKLGSCDSPLMVREEELAFVCQQKPTETQGGGGNPGSWPRTVYSSNRSGGERSELFELPGKISLLASSPTGQNILFRVQRTLATVDLKLFARRTHQVRDLAQASAGDDFLAAAWTDKENEFLLVHRLEAGPGRGPLIQIERRSLDLGLKQVVAAVEGDIAFAALSPDGRTIAYALGKGENTGEVWVRNLSPGSAPQQITHFEGVFHPHTLSISPMGDKIIIERSRPITDLYAVDIY
jgi:dipeptidyl aminopeptidase/acylaminoacyl peptidase